MQLNRDMTTMPDKTHIQGKRQHGFTLLEVLIALLILSIGLLGLAALQTTGLRSNQMASMRTLATEAAYDITDRMRANPVGVAAGEYVIALTDVTDPSATDTAPSDLNAWRERVERLPGGASEITQCDTASGCDGLTHVITVYWNETRDVNAVGHNCPPLDKTDLRCFRLVYSE
jgi:type IV pilus assembly protein PilV